MRVVWTVCWAASVGLLACTVDESGLSSERAIDWTDGPAIEENAPLRDGSVAVARPDGDSTEVPAVDAGRVDAGRAATGDAATQKHDDAGASAGDGRPGCRQYGVGVEPVSPDILIVLDRSSSMEGGKPTSRWLAAVRALKTATTQLDSSARFGLLAFPGDTPATRPPAQNCKPLVGEARTRCERENDAKAEAVHGCEPGSLQVPVEDHSAKEIAAELGELSPYGSKPTATSLEVARRLLSPSDAGARAGQPLPYVLLITDGEPGCADSEERAGASTVAAIESLADAGIKTYVIGYDTPAGRATSILDQMAKAGDTGDTRHRPVGDEVSLSQAVTKIASETRLCRPTSATSTPEHGE